MTREQWLNELAAAMRPIFAGAPGGPWPVPDKLRISVGWPSERALSKKKRVIGQCWHPKCSADAHHEIFVSPVLGDAHQAAETVLHEMIHAVVGTECGHKGAFVACAKAVGFLKPWTSTPASDELKARLQGVLANLPAFPHATLDAEEIEKLRKKQTTRLVKVECGACGYTARTTRKWLEERGAPICPCNKEPMVAPDFPEGEDPEAEDSD